MEFALTWLGLHMGDVNKEQLSLWKCEVRGPEGMYSPQLPTTSHFLSTSLWRFVPWLTGIGHQRGLLDVCSSAVLKGTGAKHLGASAH